MFDSVHGCNKYIMYLYNDLNEVLIGIISCALLLNDKLCSFTHYVTVEYTCRYTLKLLFIPCIVGAYVISHAYIVCYY